MKNHLSTLEVRAFPPIEIQQVEIVLPMPAVWFDEFIRRRLDPSRAISGIVSNGGSFITSTPRFNEDFPRIWTELETFRCKVPQVGRTVRASIPMRVEQWDCLQTAARLAGVTETELALVILARRLEIDRERNHIEPVNHFLSHAPQGNVIPGPWRSGKRGKAKA